MYKKNVYTLVIFYLLILMLVGCGGNLTTPPISESDIAIYQEETNEEGVANISFEDNNGEMIKLQIKISDSDTLELLENIDVDLVQNENGDLVLFLTDPEGIYLSKTVNLGLSKNYYRTEVYEFIPFYSIAEKLVKIYQALTSDALDEYPPQMVDQSIFDYFKDEYLIYSGRFPLSELKYSWETAIGNIGGAVVGLVIKVGPAAVSIAIDGMDFADTLMRADFVKKLQLEGYQDDDMLELYYSTSFSDIINPTAYNIPTPYIVPMGQPGEFTKPVINDIVYDEVVEEYKEIEIECFASDRDNSGPLEYYWSCDKGEKISDEGRKIKWQAPEYNMLMSATLVYFTVEVQDKYGLSDKEEFTINVIYSTNTEWIININPEILSLLPDPDTVGTHPSSAEITCNAQDPDGDDLIYKWSASGGYFVGDTDKSKVEWLAPYDLGICTITCKVIDIFGGSDTKSTNINVEETPPPPITLIGLNVFPNVMSFSDIGLEKDIDYIEIFWSDANQYCLMESQATYESLDPSVAIFTGTGEIKIKSIGPGDTQIKVSYTDSNNVTKYNYIDVHVEYEPLTKTLQSLTVDPDTMNFTAAGQTKYISEIILGWLWSDGTTSTSSLALGDATYYVYNTSVAKIVMAIPNVKVQSVGEGSTNIKVSYTYNGVTKYDYIAVKVEYEPAELLYIEAYPKNMAFDLNDTNICDDVTQVVAWYSDGSWENIDINSVSYLSNNTGVATVNSSGTVCGVGEGNTTIKVTYQGEYDTISVSVTDTGISPPGVTTLDPIYDGGYYIAMKGKIQSTGGENAYEIGFEYQDLAGGSVETINAYGNYEDGRAWNMTLVKGSDITYGHSYKYRAYAVNSAGTGYGTWDTFTVN